LVHGPSPDVQSQLESSKHETEETSDRRQQTAGSRQQSADNIQQTSENNEQRMVGDVRRGGERRAKKTTRELRAKS
jgi:hypothetical protein